MGLSLHKAQRPTRCGSGRTSAAGGSFAACPAPSPTHLTERFFLKGHEAESATQEVSFVGAWVQHFFDKGSPHRCLPSRNSTNVLTCRAAAAACRALKQMALGFTALDNAGNSLLHSSGPQPTAHKGRVGCGPRRRGTEGLWDHRLGAERHSWRSWGSPTRLAVGPRGVENKRA